MIDIKKLVITGAEAAEVGKFKHDRTKYLNASEAGSCIRKQWYSKHMAKDEEPQMWGYARRGTHGEKYIIENLVRANVPLALGNADEQWSLQDEKRKISATPDDVIKYDDEWVGLEIKTIDPRTNRSYLPKAAHVTQLQICMAMIDQEVDRPKGIKFSRGVLVYMDASNYDDVIQFEVNADPAILDRMAKRAKKVLKTSPASIVRANATGARSARPCAASKASVGSPQSSRLVASVPIAAATWTVPPPATWRSRTPRTR